MTAFRSALFPSVSPSKRAYLVGSLAFVALMVAGCGWRVPQTAISSPSSSATVTPEKPISSVPGPVPPSPPPPPLHRVVLSAPSSYVVWALVDGRSLYRSADRGRSWTPRPVPPGNFPRPDISFIDGQQGWLATGGVPETQCNGAGTAVWHTVDGGQSWRQVAAVDWQQTARGSIGYGQCKEGLSFVDPMHGFLGAWDPNRQPTIYRTADGGHTWAASTLPDPPGFVTQAGGYALRAGLVRSFGSALLIPASGMVDGPQVEAEYVFRSTDGGATWTYRAAAGHGNRVLMLITASRWLKIVNDGSAQETTDAGRTWHSYPADYQGSAEELGSFAFGDPLVGYGIANGTIYRTLDGGLHWTLIETPGA